MGSPRRNVLKGLGGAIGTATIVTGSAGTAVGDPADQIVDAHPMNFTHANRTAADIDWIVVHVPVGSYEGAINYIANPNPRNVSYHYLVSNYSGTQGPPGEITRLVDPGDIAHHTGEANTQSIAISHEWHPDLGRFFSDECLKASAVLVRHLADVYDVPLQYFDSKTCLANEDGGIIGHRHTPRRNDCSGPPRTRSCPGPDWDPDRFMELVLDGDDGGGDDGDDGPIDVGSTVATTANLNSRAWASLDAPVGFTVPAGSTGTVDDGPVESDGFTWWHVDWETESVGWSVEEYLERTN